MNARFLAILGTEKSMIFISSANFYNMTKNCIQKSYLKAGSASKVFNILAVI